MNFWLNGNKVIKETKSPRGRLPVSPRMIFAGGKLKIKKPKTLPVRITLRNEA